MPENVCLFKMTLLLALWSVAYVINYKFLFGGGEDESVQNPLREGTIRICCSHGLTLRELEPSAPFACVGKEGSHQWKSFEELYKPHNV